MRLRQRFPIPCNTGKTIGPESNPQFRAFTGSGALDKSRSQNRALDLLLRRRFLVDQMAPLEDISRLPSIELTQKLKYMKTSNQAFFYHRLSIAKENAGTAFF